MNKLDFMWIIPVCIVIIVSVSGMVFITQSLFTPYVPESEVLEVTGMIIDVKNGGYGHPLSFTVLKKDNQTFFARFDLSWIRKNDDSYHVRIFDYMFLTVKYYNETRLVTGGYLVKEIIIHQ